MKGSPNTPSPVKPRARSRRHATRTTLPPNNSGAPESVPSPDAAADESGNRALHAVATGPNPNVGRDDDDVERPPPGKTGVGSIEST
jgi:hypothetical protein